MAQKMQTYMYEEKHLRKRSPLSNTGYLSTQDYVLRSSNVQRKYPLESVNPHNILQTVNSPRDSTTLKITTKIF